jgi:hypothetical protein
MRAHALHKNNAWERKIIYGEIVQKPIIFLKQSTFGDGETQKN